MKTNPSPEEQRLLLGELNQQERENLRKGAYWETCFQSWLDSAKPSLIREMLAGPREELLRFLDSKAWSLAMAVELHSEDEAETLKELFPMWETPEMEDEEIDAETPLTRQEEDAARAQFLP